MPPGLHHIVSELESRGDPRYLGVLSELTNSNNQNELVHKLLVVWIGNLPTAAPLGYVTEFNLDRDGWANVDIIAEKVRGNPAALKSEIKINQLDDECTCKCTVGGIGFTAWCNLRYLAAAVAVSQGAL